MFEKLLRLQKQYGWKGQLQYIFFRLTRERRPVSYRYVLMMSDYSRQTMAAFSFHAATATPELIERISAEHPEEFLSQKREKMAALVQSGDCRPVLALDDEGHICGYLYCCTEVGCACSAPFSPTEPGAAYITDIYVFQSHRRKGVCEFLLYSCLNEFLDAGIRYSYSSVLNFNRPSQKAFERVGYRKKSVVYQQKTDGKARILREKTL